MNVLKTSLKLLALFISLKTLDILKALTIVVAPPKDMVVYYVTKIEPILPIAITKSKIFQPSLKYIRPREIILIAASVAKIDVKIMLITSVI